MKRHRMHMDPGFPWRKFKRHERKSGYDAKYMAYIDGAAAAECRPQRKNPYPRGVRRNEWERGYQRGSIIDAML